MGHRCQPASTTRRAKRPLNKMASNLHKILGDTTVAAAMLDRCFRTSSTRANLMAGHSSRSRLGLPSAAATLRSDRELSKCGGRNGLGCAYLSCHAATA